MTTKMQQRRGTASQWTTANPILSAGEIGFETDTLKSKTGDGTTTWTALAYQGGSTDIAATTHVATAKTTPVDADELPIVDSAASNALKRVTFANLKAWVKSSIAKADVGLGSVDNTADTAKPVSTLQQTALDNKDAVLMPTAVKTAAYTAVASDLVPVDATSATVPITLPTTPADKTRIAVKKLDATTNTVTVTAAGSDVFNKTAGSTSLTLSLQNQAIVLQYKATGAIWYVVSTDVPLGGLDTRYAPTASPTFTGTVSGITKTMVGLGSVDNTADAAKAVLSATKLATARTINGVSFDGTADINPVSAKTVGLGWYRPGYISGQYYFCNSSPAATTSSSLGNGSARVTAWIVTDSFTAVRLFADFTVAGDANSVLRVGIWADDGTGRPGTLVLDAGTISTGSGNAGTVTTGGTPGCYEITISQALTPGLYWVGGVIQGVTTTQPTVRCTFNGAVPTMPALGTTLPATGLVGIGYAHSGMTGALTNMTAPFISGIAGPRLGFKAA